LAIELVDKGLAGRPREEGADDICVDDVGKRVALLGETGRYSPTWTRHARTNSPTQMGKYWMMK